MTTFRDPLHTESVVGLDPDVPVVMLNLMKFRTQSLDGDGSGWDAYTRYSADIMPLLKARGGTIILAADIDAIAFGAVAEGDWDYAALVWYPRPAAFLDMMNSSEYAAANVHRENGTERHLILATHVGYSKLSIPTTN